MVNLRRLACLGVALLLAAASAPGQQERNDRILVVPIPSGGVTVDGDLKEWDLSAALDTALDDKLRPRFSFRLALMYDAEALYVGAHFADDTPLMNRTDPAVNPDRGWDGDALEIRLCSDPSVPYPVRRDLKAPTLCNLTMWYFTNGRLPALYVTHGPISAPTEQEALVGPQAGLTFKADADGQGWTLEGRITWTRLKAPRALKAGDTIALVAQPEWGNATGTKAATFFAEVCKPGLLFSYAEYEKWGQAEFLAQGHLPPRAQASKPKAVLPLAATLKLPDAKATTVSAAIYSSAHVLVRTLLSGAETQTMAEPAYGARIVDRRRTALDVEWDGRDDDGRPLPPGSYTVKLLTSRGIGQKWVASAHNSGRPPWQTDDGTGSWGGDHGVPVAAASDDDRVYLLWTYSECGRGLIACRPDGQKLWGSAVGEGGVQGSYAVAVDGPYVYVAKDGYPGKQQGPDGKPWTATNCTPLVTRYEAATGRSVNFPFGSSELRVGDWPDTEMRPGFVFREVLYPLCDNMWAYREYMTGDRFPSSFKAQWQKQQTHDFGPQETARNTLGLTISRGRALVSRYLENRVLAFDIATGARTGEWATESPAGLTTAPDGKVYAVSGRSLVRLEENGVVTPVVKDALSSPWGITADKDGRLYVSDCGAAMQVKVFDQTGRQLQTIGKPGGRPWIGKYDPTGMLEPAGLTVDRDGKLWVAEYDLSPKRISVWKPDGALAAEYFGPGAYSVNATVDEEHPNLVSVHNVIYDVNYDTGAVKPLCTLARDLLKGRQFRPVNYHYSFRHIGGRTYACSLGSGGSVIHLVTQGADGAWTAEPVAAWGILETIKFCGMWYGDQMPARGRELWPHRLRVMYQWHDLNGDRLIQDDEMTFTPAEETAAKASWMLSMGGGVDQNLTFWAYTVYTGDKPSAVVAFKVKEWRNGVPLYEPFKDVQPLFARPGLYSPVPNQAGDTVYINCNNPFFADNGKSELAKYRLDGQRIWAFARSYNSLQAPLPAPGDVICPFSWRNVVRAAQGNELAFVNGY
ncbi:MAG: hypothetical protein PHR35_13630, partial [Kiritimatiellae bacterium]|nr:hypothetical protein [Kiritimatiellia bacterium]